ncbi:DUF5999 family protein [Streptomyces sp. NPDC002206]
MTGQSRSFDRPDTSGRTVGGRARPASPRKNLLCNGVLVFEDTGELLPDGQIIAPHRPLAAVAA